MIQLPNDCFVSDLKVNPKNWNTTKASNKKNWFIYYRFYIPNYKQSNYPKGKLVILKGMNHFKDIEERRHQTLEIIKTELGKLKNGFNPINSVTSNSLERLDQISPITPFIIALEKTEKRIFGSDTTKRDLRSVLKMINEAAVVLRYHDLPISSVSRKHLKELLLYIETKLGTSAHRYNKIRSYLMILYKELVEMEVVAFNPVKDISKRKVTLKIRKLPEEGDRKLIDAFLKNNYYSFWLFTHIFFHSGARLTELIMVKKEDVNLTRQVFKVLIKKGKVYKEVEKTIKDIAIPYWEEVMSKASNGDFLFSKGLLPAQYL
jgi:hypothetical protein